MSCQTYKIKAIGKECDSNMGGVKIVYAIPFDSIASIAYNYNAVSGTGDADITAITTATTGVTAYKWEFRKETASMTSTANIDDANGTFSVTTELSLVFNRQSAQKRLQILAACLGELRLIVVDNNNKMWFLGEDNYVSASAAGGESGTAFADRNAYTVTLSDTAREFPREINQSNCYNTLVALGITPFVPAPEE